MTENFCAAENDNSRLLVQYQVRFLALRAVLALAGVFALGACTATPATKSEKVLRVVPQNDLTSLDPVFTTAGVTQLHGFLIYDTLFSMDANGRIMPEMIDTWDHSSDNKTWTFTLRDGIEFHDGMSVTSDDVIASLKRWGQRDTMGQRLLSYVESWEAVNSKTFRMKLNAPYGLVLETLGKPFYSPFIMPKRVADTPASQQIDDATGSGPFIYKKDERRPGEKVVYIRNRKYKPRAEPPSGMAGGNVAKMDRVELIVIKDGQTAVKALAAGEIDMIEAPEFELYPTLERNSDIQLLETIPHGFQFTLHFNHLLPPFDNPKVRQAAMAALNQPAFLQTQVGIPGRYRTCFSVYPCNSPYFTTKGMDFIAKPDMKRARQLLIESGYNGAPVVVLLPTDNAILAKLPTVATQLLAQAGFTMDLQSMDWGTLQTRRAKKDGWNIFMTSQLSTVTMDPVSNNMLSGACEGAFYGRPCDPQLEQLRNAFGLASDEKSRKAIAEQVQVRAMEVGTHVPLGEYVREVAARKTLKGLVIGYYSVFWNVEKQ